MSTDAEVVEAFRAAYKGWWREKKRTLDDLCRSTRMKISAPSMSRILRSKQSLTPQMAARLAIVLKVPVSVTSESIRLARPTAGGST